ncbi:MAG: 4'-phosphopantetheinyl transferase superfamily protein [Candidatus Omnitrophota bacterium]
MTVRSPRSALLGVDLVEIRKAKSLYQNCKRDLGSLVSREEAASIRRSRKPHERLAAILAAKEAVFKAQLRPDAGFLRFRDIRLKRRPHDWKLSFRKTKEYVIAQCVGTF